MSEKAIYLIEQYIHLNLDLKMLELKFNEEKIDVAIKIAEAIK